jgi:hypothetical protein
MGPHVCDLVELHLTSLMPSLRLYLSSVVRTQHEIISQMTLLFIVTAVITSNLCILIYIHCNDGFQQ